MLNTIYANQSQFTDLLNAIQGGDTTAIVTALGQIKTSIDDITTAFGSLSADVTQDSTQWTNLINAISSGGGGGGGTIDIDATQWSNLLTSVDKADMSTANAALGNMDTSLNAIDTYAGSIASDMAGIASALGNLGITQNATQWSNLINAINAFNSAYQSNVILGTNLDGRPSSTGVSIDLFNSAFNTSPQWTVVTNSYIDIYLYKMGILKLLWIDIAKSQIPSGWITGGLQQLPSGYEALLSPQMHVNETMRNGTQINMTVNSTGMLSINASATIAANTQVRLSFIYI